MHKPIFLPFLQKEVRFFRNSSFLKGLSQSKGCFNTSKIDKISKIIYWFSIQTQTKARIIKTEPQQRIQYSEQISYHPFTEAPILLPGSILSAKFAKTIKGTEFVKSAPLLTYLLNLLFEVLRKPHPRDTIS